MGPWLVGLAWRRRHLPTLSIMGGERCDSYFDRYCAYHRRSGVDLDRVAPGWQRRLTWCGGGGRPSQTLFGSRGPATFLSQLTAVVAALFMVTSLGLAYLSSNARHGSTITNQVPLQKVSRCRCHRRTTLRCRCRRRKVHLPRCSQARAAAVLPRSQSSNNRAEQLLPGRCKSH